MGVSKHGDPGIQEAGENHGVVRTRRLNRSEWSATRDLDGANRSHGTSVVWAFPVKLKTEEPNFQLAHIISWDHARYAAT
jgi:hypothetical protein